MTNCVMMREVNAPSARIPLNGTRSIIHNTIHVGYPHLNLGLLALLLLHLEEQRPVDPGQDTTEGDGGTDQRVQLFVTTDG